LGKVQEDQMSKKPQIIDIDAEFEDLEDGFFDERSINIRTALQHRVIELTPESRAKMAHKGKENGFYGKGYLRKGDNNHFYGKNHDDEIKQKLKQVALTRDKSYKCEFCNESFTKQHYGRYHGPYCNKNPNQVIKVKKPHKKHERQQVLICPHCEYQGGEGNMKRYHMDACPFKDHYLVSLKDGVPQYEYRSIEAIEGDDFLWSKVKACADNKFGRYKGHTFKWLKK
jgi:hypothetical protein